MTSDSDLPLPLFLWSGIGLFFAAAVEHAWLGRQFRWKVVSADRDKIVLEVPNDDYPAIYQRHLDTATLYGKVESLGATEKD